MINEAFPAMMRCQLRLDGERSLGAMRFKGLLMVTHDLVAFDIIATGRSVRYVGNGEEVVGDAKLFQIRGELEIEVVVEALGAIPNKDVQSWPIHAVSIVFGEVPSVVADW